LRQEPVYAVQGDGVYVIGQDGNRYLDACGGAAVSCLGHNHPAVVEAVCEQVHALPYAHTSFFTTKALEELGDALVGRAPGMSKVMLLSGGSEAMEAALKLSRQYFVERGETQRGLFIARRQSYHGNTLGALGVGGNEWRRKMFAPLLKQGYHVSPCFEYRDREEDESPQEYAGRLADELEEKILELGPERVAGFVAETVVGATAGAVPAVETYFERIREVCDKYGIHLILDEIMCGSGRTGTYFAYEQENVVPDIVTIAKGLAAGYQPIGALLCKSEITDAIRSGSGFFQHGHTFMGHVTAVAAAGATIAAIDDENLLENVLARGQSIRAGLREMLGDHPNVGDIRGRGLFIGIEFVEDRKSKRPFDPELRLHRKIQNKAMANGLLCYGMGGTVDGQQGDHVLIAPPYIIDETQEAELLEKFHASVTDVLGRLGR
jgi:hypothetical protein